MRSGRLTPVWLAAAVAFGCNRDASTPTVAEPQPPAASEAQAPSAAEPDESFGVVPPAGSVLDEATNRHAHYHLQGDFDDVVAYFSETLDGFTLTETADGAKFEAGDGTGRAVYVYRRRGVRDLVLLTVFDRPELATGDGTVPEQDPAVAGGGPAVLSAGATRTRVAGLEPSQHGGGSSGAGTNGAGSSGGGSSGASGADGDERGGAGAGQGGVIVVGGRPAPTSTGSIGDEPGGGTSGAAGGSAAGGSGTVRRLASPPLRGRGTTNPEGRPPLDLSRGVYEPPRNPDAYY
ncbi:MAG: hypothetical protein H6698_01980 [Myxococcales bacterium]|nr:hypothetical protein [Myxococcales bacterium]